MTTITTSIDIDAPAQLVWDTLTDLQSYPRWNPYFREASGRVAVGQTLTLQACVTGDRTSTARPRVVVATEPTEIRWVSRLGLPGLLDTEHSFTLTPQSPDRTRLVQAEQLTGLLVPLARRTIANIEVRFVELDEALKRRVEERPAR